MNELIKKYIKDNNIDLKCFKTKVLSDYIVELTDVKGEKIGILNMFDDIVIYINDELYDTYYFNNNLNAWIIKNNNSLF